MAALAPALRAFLVLAAASAAVALTVHGGNAGNATRLMTRARTPVRNRQSGQQEDYFEPSPGHISLTTPKDDGLSGAALNEAAADCVCVPYYQCDENQYVNQDGVGIIDIRIKEGQCEHYLDYCCKLPDGGSPPQGPQGGGGEGSAPWPGASNPSPSPSNPYPVSERPPEREPPHPTPPPVQSMACGQSNPGGVGIRITGAEDGEAQFGEIPWMVAVLHLERVDETTKTISVYLCGGALILPQVVLTGAHCVADKSYLQLKIRAGEWDTQTTKELYLHQDRGVAEVIVHPRFNPRTLHNDVALLTLLDPVQIGGHIGLVCLPEQDQSFDYKRCFASGWGKNKFGQDGQYQVILKKLELPIVTNPQCQEQLRRTRLGQFFQLDSSFICAGGEPGRDTCKGDGGSPLVCPMDNDPTRYYHAGIVAWGIDCGLANTPGVYGAVARFRNWIDSEMNRRRLDTNGYRP